MINLERDLRIVESMSMQIKRYVLSNTLYWSLSEVGRRGSYMLPKGTIGDMLLRTHQLRMLEETLSADQVYRLRTAQANAEMQLDRWIVQTEQKVVREAKARITAWLAYLEEIDANPKGYYAEYPTQVRNRTILSFLITYAGKAAHGSGLYRLMGHADRRLRGLTVENPFVWDAGLEPAYPEDVYWWLYTMPDLERKPDPYQRNSRR